MVKPPQQQNPDVVRVDSCISDNSGGSYKKTFVFVNLESRPSHNYIRTKLSCMNLLLWSLKPQGRVHADAKRCHGIGGPKFGIGRLRESFRCFPGKL